MSISNESVYSWWEKELDDTARLEVANTINDQTVLGKSYNELSQDQQDLILSAYWQMAIPEIRNKEQDDELGVLSGHGDHGEDKGWTSYPAGTSSFKSNEGIYPDEIENDMELGDFAYMDRGTFDPQQQEEIRQKQEQDKLENPYCKICGQNLKHHNWKKENGTPLDHEFSGESIATEITDKQMNRLEDWISPANDYNSTGRMKCDICGKNFESHESEDLMYDHLKNTHETNYYQNTSGSWGGWESKASEYNPMAFINKQIGLKSKVGEVKIERDEGSIKIDGKDVIKVWETMNGWYHYAVEDKGEYIGVGADGNDVEAHEWFGYTQGDFDEWGYFDSKEFDRNPMVWEVPKSNWAWTGRSDSFESKANEGFTVQVKDLNGNITWQHRYDTKAEAEKARKWHEDDHGYPVSIVDSDYEGESYAKEDSYESPMIEKGQQYTKDLHMGFKRVGAFGEIRMLVCELCGWEAGELGDSVDGNDPIYDKLKEHLTSAHGLVRNYWAESYVRKVKYTGNEGISLAEWSRYQDENGWYRVGVSSPTPEIEDIARSMGGNYYGLTSDGYGVEEWSFHNYSDAENFAQYVEGKSNTIDYGSDYADYGLDSRYEPSEQHYVSGPQDVSPHIITGDGQDINIGSGAIGGHPRRDDPFGIGEAIRGKYDSWKKQDIDVRDETLDFAGVNAEIKEEILSTDMTLDEIKDGYPEEFKKLEQAGVWGFGESLSASEQWSDEEWFTEIEKLASGSGVKRIPVENFLMTLDGQTRVQAEMNFENDASVYGWNGETQEAISKGISKYFSKESKANEFTMRDFEQNEYINAHTDNALQLAKLYGTQDEINDMERIKEEHEHRGFNRGQPQDNADYNRRYEIQSKYWSMFLRSEAEQGRVYGESKANERDYNDNWRKAERRDPTLFLNVPVSNRQELWDREVERYDTQINFISSMPPYEKPSKYDFVGGAENEDIAEAVWNMKQALGESKANELLGRAYEDWLDSYFSEANSCNICGETLELDPQDVLGNKVTGEDMYTLKELHLSGVHSIKDESFESKASEDYLDDLGYDYAEPTYDQRMAMRTFVQKNFDLVQKQTSIPEYGDNDWEYSRDSADFGEHYDIRCKLCGRVFDADADKSGVAEQHVRSEHSIDVFGISHKPFTESKAKKQGKEYNLGKQSSDVYDIIIYDKETGDWEMSIDVDNQTDLKYYRDDFKQEANRLNDEAGYKKYAVKVKNEWDTLNWSQDFSEEKVKAKEVAEKLAYYFSKGDKPIDWNDNEISNDAEKILQETYGITTKKPEVAKEVAHESHSPTQERIIDRKLAGVKSDGIIHELMLWENMSEEQATKAVESTEIPVMDSVSFSLFNKKYSELNEVEQQEIKLYGGEAKKVNKQKDGGIV